MSMSGYGIYLVVQSIEKAKESPRVWIPERLQDQDHFSILSRLVKKFEGKDQALA